MLENNVRCHFSERGGGGGGCCYLGSVHLFGRIQKTISRSMS